MKFNSIQSHTYPLYNLCHTVICLKFLPISIDYLFDQITLPQSWKVQFSCAQQKQAVCFIFVTMKWLKFGCNVIIKTQLKARSCSILIYVQFAQNFRELLMSICTEQHKNSTSSLRPTSNSFIFDARCRSVVGCVKFFNVSFSYPCPFTMHAERGIMFTFTSKGSRIMCCTLSHLYLRLRMTILVNLWIQQPECQASDSCMTSVWQIMTSCLVLSIHIKMYVM